MQSWPASSKDSVGNLKHNRTQANSRWRALLGWSQPDRRQVEPVDGFGELVACRYPLVAKFQSDHALCALHPVGLGAAVKQVGDDGAVADELAAHGRGLAVVDDLGRRAVAEVLLPRSAGQRIEVMVDQMSTYRDCVRPPGLSPGEAQHHQLLACRAGKGGPQQEPQHWVDDFDYRRRWAPDVYRIRLFCHAKHRKANRASPRRGFGLSIWLGLWVDYGVERERFCGGCPWPGPMTTAGTSPRAWERRRWGWRALAPSRPRAIILWSAIRSRVSS